MSDAETVHPLTREMTARNLKLAGVFMQEIFADPGILDEMPDGGPITLMPPDDSDLARYNMGVAQLHAEAGHEVMFRRVGVEMPDAPAWRANEILNIRSKILSPHMPESIARETGDLVIVYDRDRDILLIDFFRNAREFVAIPYRHRVAMRVDPTTSEVVGFYISGFLEVEAQREPRLVTTIRRAELRPLTDAELGDLIPPEMSPAGGTGSDEDKAKGLANLVLQLIA